MTSMNALHTVFLGACAATLGLASCLQSYDDFDFSGQPVGGSAGSTTTPTGTATGSGGGGAQGGSGATGGTGGAGAQGGAGGSGAISCEQQYTHGSILAYCDESATECSLNVNTRQGDHCDDICAAGGGECLDMFNDTNDGSCVIGQQGDCAATELNSGICICSRGCGGGPPCQSPQTCSGGTCS